MARPVSATRAPDDGYMPQVSVVVPTHRRPDSLERCVAALVAQDFDRHGFEIVIVDAADQARVRQIVGRWGMLTRGAPALRYVPAGEAIGQAGARNLGWRTASGEVIAFTNDDMVPHANWLSEGMRAMDSGANAAAGFVAPPPGVVLTEDELDPLGAGTFGLPAASSFVQRQALRAIGGFDERFTGGWDDDSDLQFRLIAARCELVSAPRAIVQGPAMGKGWRNTLRQYRKSAFDALLFKKHPRAYRGRARHATPWTYYLIVASLLAILAGAILRQPAVSWIGLGTWIALTAGQFSRRLHQSGRIGAAIAEAVTIPPVAVFWRLAGALRFRVFFL
jgi:GT2 family glycosyltransferase